MIVIITGIKQQHIRSHIFHTLANFIIDITSFSIHILPSFVGETEALYKLSPVGSSWPQLKSQGDHMHLGRSLNHMTEHFFTRMFHKERNGI
jgi:hypothetical protein